VVSGATGGFGSACVAVALAMGAGRVVATGRNRDTLGDLVRRFGQRVRPAPMTGVEADDRRRIMDEAGGPIDMILDLLPREASASQVHAAILAVRHGGRVVLMGGVRSDLTLNYNWLMHNDITLRGQWMYARDAPGRMVRLIRAGLIDLTQFEVTEFALEDVNTAVAHAAADTGALRLTALRPDRARSVS
jgi:alcohol dehydrogenase